jgi:ABC-2 type transport system permease protein
MKSWAVILKSLKFLIRSKGSAAVVLLGPLLIVLIIGAGFYDSSENQLNIGVHTQDNSELTLRFLENLNTEENNIIKFDSEEKCVASIKESVALTCIIFPENFKIEDKKTNEVKFYVDESRINLVHQLIASLTQNLDIESTQVSSEITTEMLRILALTEKNINENIEQTKDLQELLNNAQELNKNSETKLTNVEDSSISVNIMSISSEVSNVQSQISSLRSKASETIDSSTKLINAITYNGSEVTNLNYAIKELNESINKTKTTKTTLNEISNNLAEAGLKVDALKDRLKASRTTRLEVLTNLENISLTFIQLQKQSKTIQDKQLEIKKNIESFTLTEAASIVQPITTTIEPVTTNNNKLTYSFPYLLMLVIMFIGMMLAGTIIFMEKDSRAYFRVYTTPVKQSYFAVMAYLTSALILIAQTLLILVIVHFALSVPIFSNIGITAITIILSMSVFILIGMFLGYLFSTSEAIMMSSIALGAVMIFFSNLILPLETLAPIIQTIARFNPYVIASETIRKAMLFNATFATMWLDLLILLIYTIIIIGAIIILNKTTQAKFLTKKLMKNKKNQITVPEDQYLIIQEKGLVIKDTVGLINALRNMTGKEYNELTNTNNMFADWLEIRSAKKQAKQIRQLKNKQRNGKLYSKRNQAIDILMKYMNKK